MPSHPTNISKTFQHSNVPTSFRSPNIQLSTFSPPLLRLSPEGSFEGKWVYTFLSKARLGDEGHAFPRQIPRLSPLRKCDDLQVEKARPHRVLTPLPSLYKSVSLQSLSRSPFSLPPLSAPPRFRRPHTRPLL